MIAESAALVIAPATEALRPRRGLRDHAGGHARSPLRGPRAGLVDVGLHSWTGESSAVGEVPAGETDEAEDEQSEPAEDGHEHAEEVEILGGDLADETEGRPVDHGRR